MANRDGNRDYKAATQLAFREKKDEDGLKERENQFQDKKYKREWLKKGREIVFDNQIEPGSNKELGRITMLKMKGFK